MTRSAPAQANCVQPEPAIVWSYPADGQADVPTNARIFFLTSLLSFESEIKVNGIPTQPADYGYAPVLAPRTEYEVALRTRERAGRAQETFTFKFKTGEGPLAAEPPTAPVVTRLNPLGAREFTPMCKQAWQSMDCFDTGQALIAVHLAGH